MHFIKKCVLYGGILLKNKLVIDNNLITWIPRVLFWGFLFKGFNSNKIYILLAISVIVLSYYLMLIHGVIFSSYGKFGYLYKWYEQTMSIMGIDWIKRIYHRITNENLLNKNQMDIVFISPSANKGVYEKELFRHVANQYSSCTFIVSDKENILNHENNMSMGKSKYIYLPARNASNISKTIKECGVDKANIIWDFKGYIWYAVNNKKIDEIIDAFGYFESTLSTDGIIVLDNVKTEWYNDIFHIIYILFGVQFTYLESSTIKKLDKLVNRETSLKLKKYIEEHFYVFDIKDTEYSSKVAVRVYKKK